MESHRTSILYYILVGNLTGDLGRQPSKLWMHFLWTLYMYEHYGGQPFIYGSVHEQANGIKDTTMSSKHVTSARILTRYSKTGQSPTTLTTQLSQGNLRLLRFGSAMYRTSQGYDIPTVVGHTWKCIRTCPMDITDRQYPEWIPTRTERLPYVAWYWRFNDGAPALKVNFNGDDYAGVPHTARQMNGTQTERHGHGIRLGKTFTIPAGGATLKFWSNYDIEKTGTMATWKCTT